MTALVAAHPTADLAALRQVIARPDLHDDAVVLDACEALMATGDWIDFERAKHLRRVIAERAVREINLRARRALLIHRAIYALIPIAVLVWLAVGLLRVF